MGGMHENLNVPPPAHFQIRVPVAVKDPAARISAETLVPPERHGYVIDSVMVDLRRAGLPYRYAYGKCVSGPRPCNSHTAVCRIDVADGSVLTWCEAPALIPAGPATFVPRPGAAVDDETDGVVLVDCLRADGRAVFVILDAASFAEVARVVVPHRHCWCYCDTWVPA